MFRLRQEHTRHPLNPEINVRGPDITPSQISFVEVRIENTGRRRVAIEDPIRKLLDPDGPVKMKFCF
jgi:hypothetical protein